MPTWAEGIPLWPGIDRGVPWPPWGSALVGLAAVRVVAYPPLAPLLRHTLTARAGLLLAPVITRVGEGRKVEQVSEVPDRGEDEGREILRIQGYQRRHSGAVLLVDVWQA